ncbi:MAG TPA: hypothetical protein VNT75_00725, partial [Symbiobacteriaceae bacterium]|nr:hypothetical protein [Symbiobacteriaceae bacterium]
PGWQQTGKVTGGETVLALDGPLMLRFDRTVSPEWLQANVLVAGAGAALETDGALVGLATVRILAGKVGDDVRVRVPNLGFDLLVRRVDPLSAKVEVRQNGGPWEVLDPARLWPRKPLDLRFTFNRPVNEKAVVKALEAGAGPPEGRGYHVTPTEVRWEDGALVMHVAEPVPVLVFALSQVEDEYGLRPMGSIHRLWTGTPPALVAVDGAGDQVLAEVPVEITDAVISPDGKQLRYTVAGFLFDPGSTSWTLDLATHRLEPGEKVVAPPAPKTPCDDLGYFGRARLSPAGDRMLYNAKEPWGAVMLLDLATCQSQDLGPGLPVGWDPQGRPLVIRWADSRDRAGDRRYIDW